jgi:hypothetical protein
MLRLIDVKFFELRILHVLVESTNNVINYV